MTSAIYWALIRAVVALAGFAPLNKRRVVLCSYGGKGVGSDPGVIAAYLVRQYPDLDIVWMLKDCSCEVPAGVRKAKIFDQTKSVFGQIFTLFKSAAMFSSAKVIVCDSKGNLFRKNKRALYVQTWHGDLPFKFIEGECVGSLGEEHERISSRDSRQTDVMLSGSSFMSEIFRKYFWLPEGCKILEQGLPRNDIYFGASVRERRNVRCHYNIPDSSGVAVYAPTFRDDGDVSVFASIDFNLVRSALSKRFAKEWKILVRMHPNVDVGKVSIHYDDNVIDASGYPSGESVFLAADVLITDASSVIREFMVMRKPTFVYFPDFENYTVTCRGLRPLFFDLPFRRCASNEMLASEILAFDKETALNRVNDFLARNNICFFDDGHATESVANLIVNHIYKGD